MKIVAGSGCLKPELVVLPIEKLHQNRYICKDHFDKKSFNKKGNRLRKTAIPKLNLKSAPLTDEQLREFPQHIQNYKKAGKFNEPGPSTSKSSVHPTPDVQHDDSKADEILLVKMPDDPVPSTSKTMPSQNTKVELLYTETGASEKTTILTTSITVDGESRPEKRKLSHSSDPVLPSTSKKKKSEEVAVTPRKKKLMEQLRKTKCTLASLRKSANLIEKIESPVYVPCARPDQMALLFQDNCLNPTWSLQCIRPIGA